MAEFLNRSFFEEELDRLAAEYEAESGGQKLNVMVMLRDGQSVKREGKITCTDSYVLIDHKGRHGSIRTAVPYGSIVGVSFALEGGGQMGFKL